MRQDGQTLSIAHSSMNCERSLLDATTVRDLTSICRVQGQHEQRIIKNLNNSLKVQIRARCERIHTLNYYNLASPHNTPAEVCAHIESLHDFVLDSRVLSCHFRPSCGEPGASNNIELALLKLSYFGGALTDDDRDAITDLHTKRTRIRLAQLALLDWLIEHHEEDAPPAIGNIDDAQNRWLISYPASLSLHREEEVSGEEDQQEEVSAKDGS